MANPNNIKKVAIAGAGGIGGNVCKVFFEYGALRNQFAFEDLSVDIYDNDTIEASNLLHQDFTSDDLGKSKADVMAERYSYKAINRFMTVDDFKKYDLVFSCVDSMRFRKELYEFYWDNGKPKFWIDGRCSSTMCAAFNSTMPHEKLAQYITDADVRGSCLEDFEKQNNVCHTTPLVAAAMSVQAFLNIYRGEKFSSGTMLSL